MRSVLEYTECVSLTLAAAPPAALALSAIHWAKFFMLELISNPSASRAGVGTVGIGLTGWGGTMRPVASYSPHVFNEVVEELCYPINQKKNHEEAQ